MRSEPIDEAMAAAGLTEGTCYTAAVVDYAAEHGIASYDDAAMQMLRDDWASGCP